MNVYTKTVRRNKIWSKPTGYVHPLQEKNAKRTSINIIIIIAAQRPADHTDKYIQKDIHVNKP